MALKDIWQDIVDGDFIDPKQINNVAHGVIDNENRTDELENEINGENGWNEQAKAAAKNAKLSETNAKLSEDNAKASETNSKTSAENAKSSEDEAKTAANTATNKAQIATEAKEVSEEARDDAEIAKGLAEAAATKAENAAESAENATEFLKNGALFANALRGTLSGVSIRADDVSPIEHELDIKITGENVEGTKVTRLGKNFANLAGLPETKKYKAVTDITSGYRIDDDGNIIITTSSTDKSGYFYVGTDIKLSELCPEARVGMTMRLSAIDSYSEGATAGNLCIYLSQAAAVWAFTEVAKAITITQKMLDSNVVIYASPTLNAVRTISNFQIELGENATEYEPYIEPVEAIADAEGNVKGLMSLSPNMTLTTNNAGAVIECEYNRDANKVITDLETKLNTLIATIGG